MLGFRRFRDKYFQENLENSLYRRLSSAGQNPKTLFIGCSDSRVDPAIMTEASPGELFIIRNVASLVPPYENPTSGFHGISSAIEFAVEHLKVENVIILGHRQCGGIRAMMDGTSGGFIKRWMSIAEADKQKILAEHADADHDTKVRLVEMESIKTSVRNLRGFPFVQQAVTERNLNIIGVYFDLEQGELWEYEEAADKFTLSTF